MIIGVSGILIGSAVAGTARRFPRREAELQRWGGTLLVAGIAVLAFAFPHI